MPEDIEPLPTDLYGKIHTFSIFKIFFNFSVLALKIRQKFYFFVFGRKKIEKKIFSKKVLFFSETSPKNFSRKFRKIDFLVTKGGPLWQFFFWNFGSITWLRFSHVEQPTNFGNQNRSKIIFRLSTATYYPAGFGKQNWLDDHREFFVIMGPIRTHISQWLA